MKKIKLLLLASLCACGLHASEKDYDYVFFDNSRMEKNYFYSRADYQSPSWVEHSDHRLPVSSRAASPGNSLALTYRSAADGRWTAEVQHAPIRGNDFFRKGEVLSFLISSDAPLDVRTLPEVGIRLSDTTYTDYVRIADYLAGERQGWTRVSIPVERLGLRPTDNQTVNRLAAVVFRQGVADEADHTLYIDDIELLPSQLPSIALRTPELNQAKAYERHIDLSWTPQTDANFKYYKIYRSLDGTNFEPVDISRPWMHRYTDFLGSVGTKAWYRVTAVDYALNESEASTVVSATTRPMTDDELLDMVQEASFRYYWEGAEPNSGLARENIPGRRDMIATGASGFGLMATVTGVDRGFITREQGVDRLLRVTAFLEKADRFHGAFPHFLDGTTGKVEPFFGNRDNGADLVETSFLMQGLLVARQYFNADNDREKQIRQRIDRIWRNIEWDWFKQTPDSPFLYWHWSPDQAWTINHRLIGWNETMITYLLAIMSPKHAVGPEMYYTGWASQDTIAQAYRKDWGRVPEGSMYANGTTYFGTKLDVGVSNGGPLFFVHYSYMGLDPHKFTDRYTNYFENNRNIALINYRYCVENQGRYAGYGKDCWGLTASDFAWGYQAQEPVSYHDNGTIAPTGALASFPYLPDEAMAALKNYYRNYGHFLWGEYGFRDAFNLTENWVSPLFMGLNQAPVTVMIENYRSGLIWKLFMSHPDVQRGLKKIESLPRK